MDAGVGMGVLKKKLDEAKTQYYHFKAVVIAGMGFFTDAYDLFCISLVTKLLGRIYYHVPGSPKPGTLPPNVSAAVNGVAFCGTLAGQLFFGWLGDRMGRKRVYGLTLVIMFCSSVASGLSFGSSPRTVMATLCFFRFWLGFGIGGDYPLSATIMSEYASKSSRGAFVAAVFAMQGFGILTGGAVAMLVSAAFDRAYKAPPYEADPIASTAPQADYVWRIILMAGALPAVLTWYWRTKMPEATLDANKAERAAVDIEAERVESNPPGKSPPPPLFGVISKEFARRHGLHLVATCTTWFLVDMTYYSQNLFQKDIFSAVGWIPPARTMSATMEVFKISRAQTLVALLSTVPGYWVTVLTIDRLGRFAIQMIGFTMMTVFMFALVIPYTHWSIPGQQIWLVVLYAFTFFFANLGPNATTFMVPAQIFPATLWPTCQEISAAFGKLGGIMGSFGFLYLAQPRDKSKADAGYPAGIGVRNSLIILAVLNFLGILCTLLVPELKEKSLQNLSRDDNEEERLC
ncbi:unnamed protein product [Cuscuta campestris]|uniref:Major facilitator superfamily (MFS) profile domain-containing protein n=1 Tax=Cuscuta campestris TaxID=132261 RepID=A0A484LK35_9ASTE|nr:unnamed protein product [Cuscuta campestris]